MARVLITGCSSGFGELAALYFARRGDTVFATMRNPSKGALLKRVASDEKLLLRVLPLDVLSDDSVFQAVKQATAEAPLDVVINNAGIELRAPIEETDDDEARRQFDTNVFGLLRVTRAVLPGMRQRKSGTLVNISSIAGRVSRPFGGLYAASKHAIEAVTEAMHYELQPFGIRVVLMEPGQYATRLLDNAFVGRRFTPASPYWEQSARFDAAVKNLVPDGKLADPQEVAAAIYQAVNDPTPKLRYLVGDDAQMTVGAYRHMEFEEYERTLRSMIHW